LRRQTSGGKKSGFGDGSKYKKVSGKNPKDAMLKNEYLLSKDPGNQSYMTGMIKAAIECEYRDTAIWMADILFEHNLHHDKPSFNTYIFLRDSYAGLDVYNRALQACQLAMQIKPKDTNLQDSVRDLSAQTTLQQGRYDDDADFRHSIKDRESQEKLQAQEAVIRSVDVMRDAIEEARREYDLEPTVPGKIDKFVTTLCDTEEDENENGAIRVLEKAYVDLKQFRYKQRAGEILSKQLARHMRNLQKQIKQDPDNKQTAKKYNEAVQKHLQTELAHYKLCVENYPTDLRMKYEYGKRLLMARKYDEAIPLFQEARSDPRNRIEALSGIGGCFFYKQWYTDAVETFEQAYELLENKESATAKELLYNLGRSHEADDNLEDALNYYRKVAQIDYNYRDARKRVDALRQQQKKKHNKE
ncbi:MAG: tetratricopeptide repeat protein, partial [Sedimentisphaerales bacterium]|nr:tetratricopeptide repeat protein [Sedimentisphaerales bacterium]